MKTTLKTLVILFFTTLALISNRAEAQRVDPEKLKAAQQLLITMKEPERIMATANAMLASQAMNIPADKRDAMAKGIKTFIAKYLSWDQIKDQQAAIYANAYTTEELKALNKFYQSPIGQKVVQKMPIIQQQNAMISQKIVMAHRSELMTLAQGAVSKN